MTRLRKVVRVSSMLLLLAAILLGGCAPAATPETAAAPTTEPQVAATEAPAAAPENLGWHNVMADGVLKIAVAHVGPITDGGWSQFHHEGILAVLDKFGDKVELVGEVESMPYSAEATRTLQQFVSDGAEMIFVTSEYGDLMYPVADANPDIIFEECNGSRMTDNLVFYYYPVPQTEFLEGTAAGYLSKTGKIGFIGSFPTLGSNIASYNAFTLGARSVNPDATVHVVNINSWFDPPAERQAAEALYAEGVDFITAFVDDPAIIAFGEEKGIPTDLGGIDYLQYGPTTYVGGGLHSFAQGYIDEVQKVIDGTWTGNRYWFVPYGPGGFTHVPWGPVVPDDVKAKLEDLYMKLADGYWPFVGPIYDNQGTLRIAEGDQLTDMGWYRDWDWAVEGVSVSEVGQ
jgi:basic membrane protein A